MLDFGLPELLLIIAILILVVGPQQIPEIMYNFGRLMRRFNYMRFALSRQFDDFMHDMETEKRGDGKTDSLAILPSENTNPEEEEDEDFLEPAFKGEVKEKKDAKKDTQSQDE